MIAQKYKRYARQCRVRTRSIERRAHSSRFSPLRVLKAPSRAPGRSTHRPPPRWPRSPRKGARAWTHPCRPRASRVHRSRERAQTRDTIHIHASHARSRVDRVRRRRRAAARMRHGRDPDPRDRSDAVRRRLTTRARRRRRGRRVRRRLEMSFFRFARALARTPCFLCLRRRREADATVAEREDTPRVEPFKHGPFGRRRDAKTKSAVLRDGNTRAMMMIRTNTNEFERILCDGWRCGRVGACRGSEALARGSTPSVVVRNRALRLLHGSLNG